MRWMTVSARRSTALASSRPAAVLSRALVDPCTDGVETPGDHEDVAGESALIPGDAPRRARSGADVGGGVRQSIGAAI
jgi:hypothetical protein